LYCQKWGALILRAEIKPLYLIRIMPAEGKKSIICISLINHHIFEINNKDSGFLVLVAC